MTNLYVLLLMLGYVAAAAKLGVSDLRAVVAAVGLDRLEVGVVFGLGRASVSGLNSG